MAWNSFSPSFAGTKLVTVSASTQSVDLTVQTPQVRIVNTSTAAIAVKWALSSAGALSASFADTGGVVIAPGSTEVFTKQPEINRFAVIGLAANGYCQITPGNGL
jgi:hypothetical protein